MDSPTTVADIRVPRFVPACVLVALGIVLAAWTWGTWMHPIVDFGRELYVPWRLREGEVLYRDIAWFNGPLSQYANMVVFDVLGVSLRSLIFANLAFVAAVGTLLYLTLRRFTDRFAATAGCAAWLWFCCFGQSGSLPNFNWINPYSHELPHGVGLTILVVWLLGARSARATYAAGCVTGLVFLTKPEVFAACAITVAVAFGIDPRLRRRLRLFLGMVMVPVLGTVALLWTAMPFGDALYSTLGGWPYVFSSQLSSQLFYRSSLGIDAPAQRLLVLATWLVIWSAPIVLAYVLGWRVRTPQARRFALSGLSIAVPVGLLVARDSISGLNWKLAWSPLPVFVVAILVWRWRSYARLRTDAARASLVFAAFALALLAKIALNARLHHYGFGLAGPALAICVVAAVDSLPRLAASHGGDGWTLRAATLAILSVPVLGHGMLYATNVADKVSRLGRGPDEFRAGHRARGKNAVPIYAALLTKLRALPRGSSLVVLPEGISLNYLARLRNPTPFVNFMPPEFTMFGEDRITAALAHDPPDYVIISTRRTDEYGLRLFGLDYGQAIMRWVRANYDRVAAASTREDPLDPKRLEDEHWGIWLMKHRR